jgi:3-hydroxyisobutyrate dehydrogenase-like beta-hydroxyacid dehydrogenase
MGEERTYGFIGLGSQGGPMAMRMILAGLPTILWARRPEALEPYAGTSAGTAHTIAELGQRADHVGICVVNDDDVLAVCGELLPAMRPGSRIAIHSTIHPDTCRSIAAKAAERGIHVVDAPVSGGGPAAEAGTLTVMVGGADEDFEATRPVFETFGSMVVHLGPIGAGQYAKLINNTLFAANLGTAHCALESARQLGLSEKAIVELIAASSGRSYGFDVCARMPPPPRFAHAGRLLQKDVRLLGEVMGEGTGAFATLRDASQPFLDYAIPRDEG